MKTLSRLIVFACLASAATFARAQSTSEARAARAYETAVKAGPLAVHAFLDRFPKGADLHVHLSGAVYAETFIKDAAEDGLCVDPKALSFVKPPCDAPLVPATDLERRADAGRSRISMTASSIRSPCAATFLRRGSAATISFSPPSTSLVGSTRSTSASGSTKSPAARPRRTSNIWS